MKRLVQKICYFLYLLTMGGQFLLFVRVRRRLVNGMLGRSHEGLYIGPNVHIQDYRNLRLGDHVSIHQFCTLACGGGLDIGDFTAIGHGTSIITTEHSYTDPKVPIKYQPVVAEKVTIGSNVWIGTQSIILAGVSVANGTVIGAGSIVTRSIEEEDTIVVGIPARGIKSRFSKRKEGRNRVARAP